MEKIALAGLWKNESRDGKTTYYSGVLGSEGKLLLFSNKRKTSDKAPDLILYLAPKQKPEHNNTPDDGTRF